MHAPAATAPRVFLRCGACQRNTLFVVGRFGYEVAECFGCGRRRALRDHARYDRAPSRIPA